MFDEELNQGELSPPLSAPASAAQFSLTELFFVMTLMAVELGVYLHISSILAFISAAGLILAAVIRFADIHNFLLGSITGYLVALLVAWLFVMTCDPSIIAAVSTLLFLPACGYVLGGLWAESQN